MLGRQTPFFRFQAKTGADIHKSPYPPPLSFLLLPLLAQGCPNFRHALFSYFKYKNTPCQSRNGRGKRTRTRFGVEKNKTKKHTHTCMDGIPGVRLSTFTFSFTDSNASLQTYFSPGTRNESSVIGQRLGRPPRTRRGTDKHNNAVSTF